MTDNILWLIMTIFGLAIIMPLGFKKRSIVIAACLGGIGCLLVGVAAIIVLCGRPLSIVINMTAVYGGLSLHVDALAAFFLLITSVVGMMVSLYNVKYIALNDNPRLLTILSNLFLFLLFLIFAVDNALEFLFIWELMALTTFLLVNHNYLDSSVNRAAWVYFVAAQIGAVFIILAFATLYSCYQSFNFSVYSLATIDFHTSSIVFLLAFVGFAIKAGIVPGHGWLPAAHSVAPGNISALLSGVMLKMAVYGLIRFAFQFCHLDSYALAFLVIAFGLLSAVYGIYRSMQENEIKRILAYSSIENMGLIIAMIGLALLYKILGFTSLAEVACMAALLHSFNHALVKSALFMCAATLIKKLHLSDIRQLGGTIKLIPAIGWTFMLAGLAICGAPLLNFFVSELLMFNSITSITTALPNVIGKGAVIIMLLAFAATIALVLISFVRLLGLTFLGTPRSVYPVPKKTKTLLVLPQQLLLVVALAIGLLPMSLSKIFVAIFDEMKIFSTTDFNAITSSFNIFNVSQLHAGITTFLIIIFFACMLLWLITLIGGRRSVTFEETWACGIVPDKNMQYSSHGLFQPLLRTFSFGLARRCRDCIIIVATCLTHWSKVVRRLQNGNLHEYVAYIMAVTVVLLIVIVFI